MNWLVRPWWDPGVLGGFLRTIKNGQCRYKYPVTGTDKSYIVKKNHFDSTKKLSELTSSKFLCFWLTTYLLCLVDIFFKSVGIPIGTVPLFSLYSYETDFILLKKPKWRSFNFTFRYDVISLYNSRLGDIVDCIYPIELEINDTTDTASSASHL